MSSNPIKETFAPLKDVKQVPKEDPNSRWVCPRCFGRGKILLSTKTSIPDRRPPVYQMNCTYCQANKPQVIKRWDASSQTVKKTCTEKGSQPQ